MSTDLTDIEITEINATLKQLQTDIVNIIKNIKSDNYAKASELLANAKTHTECPMCKDKFDIIDADITKTRLLCKLGDKKCSSQKTSTIDFAENVKNTFLPIATEKNIINRRNNSEHVKTHTNSNDIEVTIMNAPMLMLREIIKDLQ